MENAVMRTVQRWVSILIVLLSASVLMAQSKDPADLADGKLLVAPRDFPDPNFTDSVILLVHYGEDGVLGLMLNRRTEVPASRVLRELKGGSRYSDPVFLGGPVERGTVFALFQSRAKMEDAERVTGDVYLLSARDDLETALASGAGSAELRIYLGYCGWTRGQLENEVRRGDWYIFDSSDKLVFDSKPETLWGRMIARIEQRFAGLRPLTIRYP
jgi:putative transcriptional regulator